MGATAATEGGMQRRQVSPAAKWLRKTKTRGTRSKKRLDPSSYYLIDGSFNGHPGRILIFIPPVKLESEAYFPYSVSALVLEQ